MSTFPDITADLDFFKIFDSEDAFFELKKELVIETCSEWQNFVKDFSFQTGIVDLELYDFEAKEFFLTSHNVLDDIMILINKQTRDIKNNIDLLLRDALHLGNHFSPYLENLDQLLIALSQRKFFPFEKREAIFSALGNIADHLRVNYNYDSQFSLEKMPFLQSLSNYSSLSYKWLAIDDESGLLSLIKFYNLLSIEPKIIECNQQEFIDAFTQGKVQNGIKWSVIGKNGQYSKQSLLNFVEYLMVNKYIQTKTHDFNKALCYVFRDNHGKEIKNLSISKASTTKVPAAWNRIKDILEKI